MQGGFMKKGLVSVHWGGESILNTTHPVPTAPTKTIIESTN